MQVCWKSPLWIVFIHNACKICDVICVLQQQQLVVRHLSVLYVFLQAKQSGLVLSRMWSEDFLFMATERKRWSKSAWFDLYLFSNPLLPHAKIDHLITHHLYLPLWLCPLFPPRFFSYHFFTLSLPPSTPSYPLHHLALRLSLSLPSPSWRCHLSTHTPTAEEFIPESGTRPYWGKVRGLSGNHVIECAFVRTAPLCFPGLYVSVSEYGRNERKNSNRVAKLEELFWASRVPKV